MANFEHPESENITTPPTQSARRSNFEDEYQPALNGESFEDTSAALESVEALQQFRAALGKQPFGSFYDVFEDLTLINRRTGTPLDKKAQMAIALEALEERAARFSPRVADLYLGILAQLGNKAYESKFPLTKEKLAELQTTGDLRTLVSGRGSWDLKLNRIETRLDGYLRGARALDRREGKKMADDERTVREEKLEKIRQSPNQPPERRNESKPSMDEMERLKEGERVPAIWQIHPAYGGYYREQSFSQWDSERNVWREPKYEYRDPVFVPLSEKEDPKKGLLNLTLTAEATAGRWVSVPLPYTHGLHKIESGDRACHVQQDQNGDLVVMVEGEGSVPITIIAAPQPDKQYGPVDPQAIKPLQMPANFSAETQAAIAKVEQTKKGTLARGRALASYTRRRLHYSNESKYNAIYDNYPEGYFAGIDKYHEADCDVGNTYHAALCAQLNIPVRQVVGHSVKGRDLSGASAINSGTGHGWNEVWDDQDNKWVRIDATPPGDPNLEDQQQENAAPVPGDYGNQEAVRPTDERLEKLRQKLEEKKEQLSYTKEERELAAGAGVELREARQIVKEIQQAEITRLPNGELVTDALAKLFNAIVDSRKVLAEEYSGPVTKQEGGESIEDIVRHKIGVMSGQADPMTREKPDVEEREEQSIGEFDVYFIGDKSGSMRNTSEEGEPLWQLQRRAEYLIFSALHRFEQALNRARIQKSEDLSVRTQGISFRNSSLEDIDLDKSLSGIFTPQDKVALWHSLSQPGSGNGDTAALTYIRDQIGAELEAQARSGNKEKKLRLVIACSDGGPDSEAGVQELAKEIGQLGAVVVGIGLTESAAAVPIIYDTPYSRGDIARDINDLPALVAKHLVQEAIKLFPQKARASAQGVIDAAIAKFRNVR